MTLGVSGVLKEGLPIVICGCAKFSLGGRYSYPWVRVFVLGGEVGWCSLQLETNIHNLLSKIQAQCLCQSINLFQMWIIYRSFSWLKLAKNKIAPDSTTLTCFGLLKESQMEESAVFELRKKFGNINFTFKS